MDHQETVNQFIAGMEVTVPFEEVGNFYRCLIDTLDAMGNAVVSKPANPLAIAYGLYKMARENVLSRKNYRDAEQALRVALRIFAYLTPADIEIQAESCRLLAILLAAQGRYQDAQLCDEKAVSLAMSVEPSGGASNITPQ